MSLGLAAVALACCGEAEAPKAPKAPFTAPGAGVPCLGGRALSCMEPARYERALATGRNIRREYRNDEDGMRWLDTLTALDSPFYVRDARLACAREFGDGIEQCNYRMSMVLANEGSGDAEVVFARAAVLDESSPAGCVAYADCTAAIRVGSRVPLPAAVQSGDLAIELVLQANSPALTPEFASKTPALEGLPVEFLRALVAEYTKIVAENRGVDYSSDREMIYTLATLERSDIAYMELLISEREGK
ncbi:hypothetical protein [Nannocystis radixulma]|uniref:Lipoprotein n=1 Tax=Nannocystis radixulma TaxID=2995305 RepID=A0ABT5BG66_9BACT|nr:hypothetical protein [Nannocystis radixulma]MDC0672037.1 hypothetical protein [Nannocystis radixulma]